MPRHLLLNSVSVCRVPSHPEGRHFCATFFSTTVQYRTVGYLGYAVDPPILHKRIIKLKKKNFFPKKKKLKHPYQANLLGELRSLGSWKSHFVTRLLSDYPMARVATCRLRTREIRIPVTSTQTTDSIVYTYMQQLFCPQLQASSSIPYS